MMIFGKVLLWIGFLLYSSFGVQAIGTTTQTTFSARITGGVGCHYGDQVGTIDGFAATFYSYPNRGKAGWAASDGTSILNTDFFMSDYSMYGLQASTTGVLEPTFTVEEMQYQPDFTSNVFGVDVTVQHFLVELDGYFFAKVSGLYTFKLLAVDDLAAVWFGSGLSCCDMNTPKDSDYPSFWATWDRTSNQNGAAVAQLYLTAGIYYPIKVRFANTNRAGALSFEVTDPSGNTINDFKGSAYRFVNINKSCSTVTVSFPFDTITVSDQEDSTFAVPTTTEVSGVVVTTTVVVVEVSTTSQSTDTTTSTPVSSSSVASSSTTSSWEFSATSSLSSLNSSTSSSSEVLSTITEDPDIPAPYTTTKLTTLTRSDGIVETTSIVVVEVPATTSTSVANNTIASNTTSTSSTTIQTSMYLNTSSSLEVSTTSSSSSLISSTLSSSSSSLIPSTLSSSSLILSSSTLTSSASSLNSSTSSSSEVLSTITEDPDIPAPYTTTKLTTLTRSDGIVETTSIVVVEVPATNTTLASKSESRLTSSIGDSTTSTTIGLVTSAQNVESATSGTNIYVNSKSTQEDQIKKSNTVSSTLPVNTSSASGTSEVLSATTEVSDNISEHCTTTKLTTLTRSDGSVETTRVVVIEVPATTTIYASGVSTTSSISSVITDNDATTSSGSFRTSQLRGDSSSSASSFKSNNEPRSSGFIETSSSSHFVSDTSSISKTLVTNSAVESSPYALSESSTTESSRTTDSSPTKQSYSQNSATKETTSFAGVTTSPIQVHDTYTSTTISISQQSAVSYTEGAPQVSIYIGGAADSKHLDKIYYAFAFLAFLPFV